MATTNPTKWASGLEYLEKWPPDNPHIHYRQELHLAGGKMAEAERWLSRQRCSFLWAAFLPHLEG